MSLLHVGESSVDVANVVFVSEALARPHFAGATIRLVMVKPPYPAFGIGELRVLRIREVRGHVEIAASYDRYERIAAGSESRRRA